MKDSIEYSITEEDLKTLDTDNIEKIVLKDGTILKFNSNTSTPHLHTCTCNKNKNTISSNSSSNAYKKENKYISLTERSNYDNNKNGFYVTPVPNLKPKIIAIKVPEYEEQKEIKYNIKTFTFESEPKKYKYKPYKSPNRKFSSRMNYMGCNCFNQDKFVINYNNINQCTCRKYCTCRKNKRY